LIEILVEYDTEEYSKKEATKFNGFLKLFSSNPTEGSLIDTESDPSEPDSVSDTEIDTIN
jgi:hypothetical protein